MDADGAVGVGETDPNAADSDGDGLGDGTEVNFGKPACEAAGATPPCGTDPLNPDTDSDGLCDGPATVTGECVAGEDQNANGQVDAGETDPRVFDTDGGGVGDGAEVNAGTDPLDPSDDGGVVPTQDSRSFQGGGCGSGGSTYPALPWLTLLLGLALLWFQGSRRRASGRPGQGSRQNK